MQPAERDILAEIRDELRLSREQRERSETRYAQVVAESDARHAELQREVLESNRLVMRRMDGLARENQAVLAKNTEAIEKNTVSIDKMDSTLASLKGLAETHTEALFRIFERLPPPGEAAA